MVLLLAALLFGALTVQVDEMAIRVVFGIGLARRTIPLADVVTCERIPLAIYWGWGLHWTPSGWLYNVGGRTAVRLALHRQRAVIIGSDDADRLKAAIDARIARRAQGTGTSDS